MTEKKHASSLLLHAGRYRQQRWVLASAGLSCPRQARELLPQWWVHSKSPLHALMAKPAKCHSPNGKRRQTPLFPVPSLPSNLHLSGRHSQPCQPSALQVEREQGSAPGTESCAWESAPKTGESQPSLTNHHTPKECMSRKYFSCIGELVI